MSESAEVVVIGAGPAGLQLSYELTCLGVGVTLLERDVGVGSFFRRYPRHGRLISINKPVTGFTAGERDLRWDWHSLFCASSLAPFSRNCGEYFPAAHEYLNYLDTYCRHHELPVRLETEVVRVCRQGRSFQIDCADGQSLQAPQVVVATGLSQPRRPRFEGAEHVELYSDVSIDAGDFHGRRVLIIGKGNSGFETANHLTTEAMAIHLLSRSPTRFAWQTSYVGNVRSVNCSFLDTHRLRSQNNIIDAEVVRIERKAEHLVAHIHIGPDFRNARQLVVDRVIGCLGFCGDFSILAPECSPILCQEDRFPLLTSSWEATTVPNLFFAGALMHGGDFRRSSSGFIHGFRHNVSSLAAIIFARQRGVRWSPPRLKVGRAELVDFMLDRLDTAAAMFNQPGFYADVFVPGPEAGSLDAMLSVPLQYVLESEAAHRRDFLHIAVTLEYGCSGYVLGGTLGQSAQVSQLLHPVIRHMHGMHCLAELHLPEDLGDGWSCSECRSELQMWLQAELDLERGSWHTGAA